PQSATYLPVRGLPASLSCSVFAGQPRTNSRKEPLMATTTAPLELSPVIDGREVTTGETYEGRSPYDEALGAVIHRAGPREIEAALAGGVGVCETTRRLRSWKRSAILAGIADRIEAAKDDFARAIALEAGKPVKAARIEAERAAFTFRVASEETKRIYGE